MVSERALAAALPGPCGRLEGSRGTARAPRAGRGGRRLPPALPAGARTMPGGPSGRRRRRLQHRPALGGGAPGAPAPLGAPGELRARSREPHPGSSAAARRAGWRRAGWWRWRGPRSRSPGNAEPSRCRLYLRSRLTSAARVPRARAPPGDLAHHPRPHPSPPPRTHTPGRSCASHARRSPGQLGAGLGGGAGGYSAGGLDPRTALDSRHPGVGTRSRSRRHPDPDIDPGADASTLHR